MDIAEAIDTADPSLLDSAEFSETDAIPAIEVLPKNHYLADEVKRKKKTRVGTLIFINNLILHLG